MKTMKRFLGIVLAVCLMVPCFSTISRAANGVLSFSDPTTAVGQTFDVKIKIDAGGEAIGDGFATVTYDPAKLKYVGGMDTTGGDGKVELKGTGNGSQTALEYTVQFMALAEGTATLEVADYTSYLFNDETLHLSLGSSTITIGPGTMPADENGEGTPVAEPNQSGGTGNIEIDGVRYQISDDFSDALIPIGYVRAEMQVDGATHQVAKQELGEAVLVYLDNGTQADFFYTDGDDGSYAGIAQVEISRDNYILLLQSKSGVSLPEEYQETTFEAEGKTFPAWQDSSQTGFCVVNTIDSRGKKTLYQVDSQDKTYQRFVAASTDKAEKDKLGGNLEKIFNWLHDNIEKALIGLWLFVVVVIVVIIILSSKLHNRNRELDDLYDEYGIDDSPKPKKAPAKGKEPVKARKQVPKKEMQIVDLEDDDIEDDDDDFDNDIDFEDDGFDDDFEDDDDFDDYDSYEDYDSGYDMDLEEEDRRPSRGKEDFDIDFIKLD